MCEAGESIEIQRSDTLCGECPPDDLLIQWVVAGLRGAGPQGAGPQESALQGAGLKRVAGDGAGALTIRIVDEAEIRACNNQWRGKDKATNVLSFAAEFPAEAGVDYLGDMMVCAAVVMRESEEQGKPLNNHWAHIVVHGVLHLRGFDHENAQDAEIMEQREKEILATLGVADPYRDDIDS